MSWKKPSPSKRLPLPAINHIPHDEIYQHEKLASNGGRGTDDALKVSQALQKAGIPCCFVGISALIFYGAERIRPDWEICVPDEHITQAASLFQSQPYSADYCLVEPWQYPSMSLLHTYHRFKGVGTDFYFILVPANDVHIKCEPQNITRSLRGLPYPKLDVFVQSCLDTVNELQLCDVIDGTDLSEEWGEENLNLDGCNDAEWAKDINRRAEEFDNGKFADWTPPGYEGVKNRRTMWQSLVRTKKNRMGWTKPSDIFVTQYLMVDDPDPWTVLSEDY